MNLKIFAHTSFLGTCGYNAHSKAFFTNLNNLIPTRIRNFTYVSKISEFEKKHLHLLVEQDWQDPPYKIGNPFVKSPNDFVVNIVLNESNHHYFYDQYSSPKIGFNVWESTRQMPSYFNKLLEYDQFWCPTEWQAKYTIEQGYPSDRVKIVPEGVDGDLFKSRTYHESKFIRQTLYKKYNIPKDAVCFMAFGRWDYRKSIKEIVQSFLEEFKNDKNIYLVLSADNPFPVDGMKTTEERLKHHNLESDKIRILHFPPQQEYIHWLQSGNIYVSCSRSEGWNLPLMEAIACGCPSICSNWGGQEFAFPIANLVNVPKELPPHNVFMFKDGEDIGVWGEPDFDHLKYIMRRTLNNHGQQINSTTQYSKILREKYTWQNAASIAEKNIKELVTNKYHFVESNITTAIPKVSFVTSFFNSEKYIDDLSKSVLNQTLTNWEWIVTDDFSSDNTKEKVLTLCKKDRRIKYIEQRSKQEIYWNPHIYANGELILTIDADDQLVPKTAEVISRFFDKFKDVSCIHTNSNYYHNTFDFGNFKNSSHCKFDSNSTILEKHRNYLKNESGYERVGYLFGAIRAYRNPGGRELNFNDGNFTLGKHEDLVKLIRLEEIGKPLFLNRTLYKNRMRDDSNSKSWGDNSTIQEFDKIYNQVEKRNLQRYTHEIQYECVSDELYPFLYSELNEERDRKKVSCIGFNLTKEKKYLLEDIYYDHEIVFDAIDTNSNYIFILVRDEKQVDFFYNIVKKVEKAKVLFFFINKDWTPDFYKVEDSSKYFDLFNKARDYFTDKATYYYNIYLYKYCLIKFEIQEKSKVRLNIGCGNDIKAGYINIDKYNNTGKVDLNCDMGSLPFSNNTVDEIFTCHVFEHIGLNDMYSVLDEWKRVLKIGGKLVLNFPNLESEVKIWLNTPDDKKWFELHRIFGQQSHAGNTHFCGFNPGSLKSFLESYDFEIEKNEVVRQSYGDEIQCIAINRISSKVNKANYTCHFVDGPFLEITGDGNDKSYYQVDFIDPESNSNVHQTILGINQWTRPHRKYYTNWIVQVRKNGKLEYEHKFNLEGKNVLVSMDSKSLGDTIAFVPQVEEFRKTYKCNVWLSTFWNKLFRGHQEYSNLHFIEPGQVVNNLYCSHKIGCYDEDLSKNKVNWKSVPLQKVCSDILGLEYKEIVCNLSIKPGKRPIEEKYVAISQFSTFQCKFWNYPNGWQEIVDYLNEIGYKVMVISKEKTDLKNIINRTNRSIEESITNIYHSDFFIGISSGPSWLAWALRKPVIMISGFSLPSAEFETNCHRIINTNVCHGCFNQPGNSFDRGNWNWCPRQSGTERQFECTKKILPEEVIKRINIVKEGLENGK